MAIVKDIGHRLFSLYCWVGTYTWMMVGSFVALPLIVILGQLKGHRYGLRPALGGCVPLCFIKSNVHFHPDYEPEQRGVYIQNHVSVLDGSIAT